MTTAAPAPSLADLERKWHEAVATWRKAHAEGASEARLLELEAAVDGAERRWAHQERRIKLAMAGRKGWYQ